MQTFLCSATLAEFKIALHPSWWLSHLVVTRSRMRSSKRETGRGRSCVGRLHNGQHECSIIHLFMHNEQVGCPQGNSTGSMMTPWQIGHNNSDWTSVKSANAGSISMLRKKKKCLFGSPFFRQVLFLLYFFATRKEGVNWLAKHIFETPFRKSEVHDASEIADRM